MLVYIWRLDKYNNPPRKKKQNKKKQERTVSTQVLARSEVVFGGGERIDA
jgi:hypothetical protein